MKFTVYTSDGESLGVCETEVKGEKIYLNTSKGTFEIPNTLYEKLLDTGCWDLFVLDDPFTNNEHNLSIQVFEKVNS